MASTNYFHARPNYIYPTSEIANNTTSSDNNFEFDESDVWTMMSSISSHHVGPIPNESKKTIPSFRQSKKMPAAVKKALRDRSSALPEAASLPVSVPDWSEILKEAYRDNRRRDSDGDDDSDENADVDDRIPPHEYLARTRGASFSVHEGIGRTLKGRDLRRVRNAIWKKVGFED